MHENMEPQLNDVDRVKPKDSENIYPIATSFTRTWTEQSVNLGLSGERPMTNHVIYGMAKHIFKLHDRWKNT
jgi:hypothetical protein